MCKKKFQSPCVCRNTLYNPRWLTMSVNSADCSKASQVRKFYTAYTGVVETNCI